MGIEIGLALVQALFGARSRGGTVTPSARRLFDNSRRAMELGFRERPVPKQTIKPKITGRFEQDGKLVYQDTGEPPLNTKFQFL